MIVDTFRQQPGESRQRTLDYSRWLGTGETLVSVLTSVEKVAGDADDSANPFEISGAVVSDTQITYFAEGGADGNKYKATFSTTTSIPQVREDEVEFRIRED